VKERMDIMQSEKSKKKTGEGGEDYEEKIKKLEKRLEELEKEKEHEPSIVEGVAGQLIPGLGGIVKVLEKSSPEFRKRIAETDAEIKHRIETGWNSKPRVEYGISIKPLISERKGIKEEREEEKVEEIEKEPIVDVFEEKDYISVIAELPGIEEKDIKTKLTDNALEISAGKYSKTVNLPSIPKSIIERTYKHGILQLKIGRK
jgi:HSP20 family molecular chaperone IbpA